MAIRLRPPPKHLVKMTQEELDVILRGHKLYVKSSGRRGSEAQFKNYDFTGMSFREGWLQGIDFRGNWFQSCDFNFARVDGCNFEDCWVEGSTSHGVVWGDANIDGTLWAQP